MQTELLPKDEFVRQGFNHISDRYDLLNDLMTVGMHRLWKKQAVRRLHLQPGMNILDLCSGTGDLARQAALSMKNQGHVTALDFAPDMIRAGRLRSSMQQYQKTISWIRSNACSLPFQNESFHGAIIGFGLRNVVSIQAVLLETWRILKPGAYFVSLDTAPTEWRLFMPFYRIYMKWLVPWMGKLLAGSREMYSYLSSSAAAFHTPQDLCELLNQCHFCGTGYQFRPRILGGSAIVWGKKPLA